MKFLLYHGRAIFSIFYLLAQAFSRPVNGSFNGIFRAITQLKYKINNVKAKRTNILSSQHKKWKEIK